MTSVPFRVVLTGRTLRGKTAKDVAIALGPLVGLDAAAAVTLLGDRATALQTGLSQESARHYVAALAAVGAEARSEAEATLAGTRDAPGAAMAATSAESAALAPLVVAPGTVHLSIPPEAPTARPPFDAWWLWGIAGAALAMQRLGGGAGLVALLVFLGLRPLFLRLGEGRLWSTLWAGSAALVASLLASKVLATLT